MRSVRAAILPCRHYAILRWPFSSLRCRYATPFRHFSLHAAIDAIIAFHMPFLCRLPLLILLYYAMLSPDITMPLPLRCFHITFHILQPPR